MDELAQLITKIGKLEVITTMNTCISDDGSQAKQSLNRPYMYILLPTYVHVAVNVIKSSTAGSIFSED